MASTASGSRALRSARLRHTMTAPLAHSTKLSSPNPRSAMLPTATAAATATMPSRLFQPTGRYARRSDLRSRGARWALPKPTRRGIVLMRRGAPPARRPRSAPRSSRRAWRPAWSRRGRPAWPARSARGSGPSGAPSRSRPGRATRLRRAPGRGGSWRAGARSPNAPGVDEAEASRPQRRHGRLREHVLDDAFGLRAADARFGLEDQAVREDVRRDGFDVVGRHERAAAHGGERARGLEDGLRAAGGRAPVHVGG